MTKKFLKCAKCGKIDTPDKTVIPHNVGTSTKMRCRHCDGLEHSEPKLYDGPATMCRACCPTGHGTRFEYDSK